MNTPAGWLSLLVACCILGPYVLGVRPRRRADWLALTLTVAFLIWLLGGFTSVRSR